MTTINLATVPQSIASDPYEVAATRLHLPLMQQAMLTWATLTTVAQEVVVEDDREQAYALVALGCQQIPVRDFVLSSVARLDDEEAEPFMLALASIAGSARPDVKPMLAAMCAALGSAFNFEADVIEVFLDRAGDIRLADLVRQGIAMNAASFLFRRSMSSAYDGILQQLQSA